MMKKSLFVLAFLLIVLSLSGCKNGLIPTAGEILNRIPKMLDLDGPGEAKVGQQYKFVSLGEDPDGDQIAYHFGTWFGDLYDETYRDLGWTTYQASNTEGHRMIAWSEPGTYTVCSYCIDTKGGESVAHFTIEVNVVK